MQSIIDTVPSAAARPATRQPRLIWLDAPAPVVWRIRRLGAVSPAWARGFPYFEEAAELLDSWGLYSRSAVLRVLRERAGLSLGDDLRHRLLRGGRGGPALYLADVSCGWLHCLRPRA